MAAKTPRETGVWVLTVEPQWGSRGARLERKHYFRNKPSDDKVRELACGNHFSLVRRQCGRAYSTTTYH